MVPLNFRRRSSRTNDIIVNIEIHMQVPFSLAMNFSPDFRIEKIFLFYSFLISISINRRILNCTRNHTAVTMAEENNKLATKVVDTAKEEVQQVTQLARDGARSGAYMYPIKVQS